MGAAGCSCGRWRPSRPSSSIQALLAASIALVGAFVAWERAAARPLMDLRLLARRAIWTANASGLAVGFAFCMPFPLVSLIAGYPTATGYGLGLSSTGVALVLVPGAVAALVGGLAGGRLVTLIGARHQAILGCVLATASYAGLLALPTTGAGLACALIPMGAAIGLAVGAIISLTLRGSSPREAGITASMNTVVRTLGSALGPQVAIAIVVAAPALASGLPAEDGFENAFRFGLLAAIGALACAWIVPSARTDPLVLASRTTAT
jgi:Na+/melibiose symporter-like transporter